MFGGPRVANVQGTRRHDGLARDEFQGRGIGGRFGLDEHDALAAGSRPVDGDGSTILYNVASPEGPWPTALWTKIKIEKQSASAPHEAQYVFYRIHIGAGDRPGALRAVREDRIDISRIGG